MTILANKWYPHPGDTQTIYLRQKGALSHEEWIRLSDLLLRWASNQICLEVEFGTPLSEKPV